MGLPGQTHWNEFWGREQSKKFGRISHSKQRIIEVLRPYVKGGEAALDAGCGSGFFSAVFCDYGMKTVAADYSKQALDLAGQNTDGRCRLLQVDFLGQDLSRSCPERFDLIFSDGLFEHFPEGDKDRILKNFISVLKEDGVVVTVVPNRWSPWQIIRPFMMPGIEERPFVLSELISLHERNGLTVFSSGGLNALPFRFSPEMIASKFGMLLYAVARKRL
jgi:SAM-dependent methyltransferase